MSQKMKNHPDLVPMVDAYKHTFQDDVFGDDYEAIIADSRYNYITENFQGIVIVPKE